MSFLSKNFWKGIITGGIASILVMNFLQEMDSREMQGPNIAPKGSSKQSDDLLDKVLDETDQGVDMLKEVDNLGEVSEKIEDAELKEKISVIQEEMEDLTSSSES